MAKLHLFAALATFATMGTIVRSTIVPPSSPPIASPTTWTEYAATNCFNGHGGASKDPNAHQDPSVRDVTLQQCKNMCMGNSSCAGVVYGGELQEGDLGSSIGAQCWLRFALNIQYCDKGDAALAYTTYTNGRDPFKWITDFERDGGKKTLGAGVYYIDRQYVMPSGSSLAGAGQGETIIQAVRWLSQEGDSLCGADAKHRIGLIVGNDTYLGKFTYTGVDKSRPFDNLELCSGDAIEFPGCNEPYCDSHQYTGNGNGNGANNVLIEDIDFTSRYVQNMVFVPQTDKGKLVSSNVHIRGLSTQGTWADGLNIHGAHRNFLVENCEAYNTGDDCFAAWDSSVEGAYLYNITFKNNKASNPHFDGNNRDCYSQFGGQTVNYIGNQCNNPTHAMIHFWIQFCGSGQAGSPGKSICYPSDAVSIVEGNTLTGAGPEVKNIEEDSPKHLPKIVTSSNRPTIMHV